MPQHGLHSGMWQWLAGAVLRWSLREESPQLPRLHHSLSYPFPGSPTCLLYPPDSPDIRVCDCRSCYSCKGLTGLVLESIRGHVVRGLLHVPRPQQPLCFGHH